MTMIVFVYGTLKKGYGLNHVLKNSVFLGNAVTVDKFYFGSNGFFPAIIRKETPHAKELEAFGFKPVEVKGEVYKVDKKTYQNLLFVEGVPTLYVVNKIKVKIDNKIRLVNAFVINDKNVLFGDYPQFSNVLNDGVFTK